MDAYDALISRVSPIDLGDPAPDEATLRKLIAAGIRAPDHGRLRPWRFISICGDAREHFGDILAKALARRDADATEDALQRERKKALRAPLILVVAAQIVLPSKIPPIEQVLSAGAAAQNIILASPALGFGAVWKTGDAAYDHAVKQALGLQAADAIVGFLYIGTPKTMPKAPMPIDPAEFLRNWPAAV